MIHNIIESVQSSKNIWIIIISVIITALVVGGGIFLWQNFAKQKLLDKISMLEHQPESTTQESNNDSRNQLELCNRDKNELEQLYYVEYYDCQHQLQAQQDLNKQRGQESLSTAQNAYIEKDTVYYTNDKGEKIIVAQSINNPNDPFKNIIYRKAELSPNKKFILLGSVAWEAIIVEVYDISTGEIHSANASGSEFGEWLSDNILKIIGECGMGISCGIYESIDSRAPWVLERIFYAE